MIHIPRIYEPQKLPFPGDPGLTNQLLLHFLSTNTELVLLRTFLPIIVWTLDHTVLLTELRIVGIPVPMHATNCIDVLPFQRHVTRRLM